VTAICVEGDSGIEPLPWLAADKRPRFGARRSAWPTWAWFDSRLAVGGKTRCIALVRRFASKGHVRSVFIVPLGDRNHLPPECVPAKRDQRQLVEYLFQGQDQAFNHRDAAMLANCAEARSDVNGTTGYR